MQFTRMLDTDRRAKEAKEEREEKEEKERAKEVAKEVASIADLENIPLSTVRRSGWMPANDRVSTAVNPVTEPLRAPTTSRASATSTRNPPRLSPSL